MFGILEPNVPQTTVDEVKESLEKKEDVILLDVRTVNEYSRGNIEGSINIPLDEVAKKIHSVISDKSKKVYVYCLSGSRSIYAVDVMAKLGYTKVLNVSGGLLRWRAQGYPISVTT